MKRSRGTTDATYALLASGALMAGLLLLSIAGTPFSLMEGSGQQPSLDPQDLELLENGSIDPSEYVDQETAQDAAEAAADSGMIRSIARRLFELLSGQQIRPPGGEGLPNGTGMNGTDGNRTLEEGNTTDGGDGGGSSNQTIDDGNETDTSGNETVDDTNQTGGGSDQTSDGNETGTDDQQQPGNETDDGSQQDDGGADGDQGTDDTNSSAGEDGFLQGLMDGLSSVFNGSGSQESPTDPTSNRSGTGSDTGQEGGTEDTQQDDAGAGRDGPLLDRLWEIAPYLLALALLIVAVMFYRSDADARTFLRRLLERLRRFITVIPDLFRHLIVDTISFLIAKVRALYRFIVRLVRRPVLTLREMGRSLRSRIQDTVSAAGRMRERGLRGCVDAIAGKGAERDGLDRLWYRLKQELGLGGALSVTPAEVRELALRNHLPQGPVDELVEAFRQEKYTAEGYPETIDMEAWERALWGEEDE